MSEVDILPEVARWRARAVRYYGGFWKDLSQIVPKFQLADFVAGPDEPANPFLQTVIRLPVTLLERPTPVGVVSKNYALVQHRRVAELCLSSLAKAGIEISQVRCDVGLSSLDEWMNFRAYLPESFGFVPKDGHKLKLRVEAFNSVDGSSRLTVLLSWFRLICSNGLAVRESIVEISDIHNRGLDLGRIEPAIVEGTAKAAADQRRLTMWQDRPVDPGRLEAWTDDALTKRWGKKAACRVFHICLSGRDVEIANPFEPGSASAKPVRQLAPVPGAAAPAGNLYDVCQALSWVASRRNNAEERADWQADLPMLIKKLAA